jgi:hypothetical protein
LSNNSLDTSKDIQSNRVVKKKKNKNKKKQKHLESISNLLTTSLRSTLSAKRQLGTRTLASTATHAQPRSDQRHDVDKIDAHSIGNSKKQNESSIIVDSKNPIVDSPVSTGGVRHVFLRRSQSPVQ